MTEKEQNTSLSTGISYEDWKKQIQPKEDNMTISETLSKSKEEFEKFWKEKTAIYGEESKWQEKNVKKLEELIIQQQIKLLKAVKQWAEEKEKIEVDTFCPLDYCNGGFGCDHLKAQKLLLEDLFNEINNVISKYEK